MRPNLLALTLSILVLAAPTQAAEWAEKMFPVRSHDFGTVARAAKAEFYFPVKNIYAEPVHILAVRASCGCTTPTVTKETIERNETGYIIATFNTDRFLGSRRATIKVTLDRPQPARVELTIEGFVRRDVVIDPGVVRFGEVASGQAEAQAVNVAYAGRDDWQLMQVESSAGYLQTLIEEKRRQGGRVDYRLTVRLSDHAPAGYIQEELVLLTNDRNSTSRRIPLKVEGRVVPHLSVQPRSLYLGDLVVGEPVTKKLIVRGRIPFKVLAVKMGDRVLDVEASKEAKPLHVLSVTFTPEQPGPLENDLVIETDLTGQSQATCRAVAQVRQP